MIYVYAILSEVTGRCYVGISEDVTRRLSEHNAGKMKYTKAYRPWRLVYEEACPDRASARRREKYFKTGGGRRRLQRIIAAELREEEEE